MSIIDQLLFPAHVSPESDTQIFASTDAQGPFAQVAIEQSVDKVLDYTIPVRFVPLLAVGQRVRVPLGRGNKPAFGYVVNIVQHSNYARVKPLLSIDDDRILIHPPMMELARWISRYYVAPLGMVLDGIIPGAVKKRIGLGYSHQVRPAQSAEALQAVIESSKNGKRRTILSRLLQVEPGKSIELHTLAFEAGVTVPTVRALRRTGVITITAEPDLGTLDAKRAADLVPGGSHQLNAHQRAAVDAVAKQSGFNINLLFGVTGSGKTEVYLHLIRQIVDAGKQAIVLVPEIALTPQTVRRFTERFAHVAVQHSALTNTERHRAWQQISTGQAQVIVGARSAVFAPTPKLGLIVVDEEHEPSYKQDSLPRYHGRDVAIKRAQIENIPVLLGTATPSLETWHNIVVNNAAKAEPSIRHLLRLPERVRGLALPKVETIDMREAARLRKGHHLFSPRLESLIKSTLNAGEQTILLLNRRGYANCIFCSSCNEAIKCKFCDATMTYHRASAFHPETASNEAGLHTGQMHCHYCLTVNALPAKCPTCDKKLSLFGLGTQRVEEELQRKFPGVVFARADSDTMRSRSDYEALLSRFGAGEIQVMLGTQMIAKGLDYPNVTLVGVISGDTALSLPDFRAAERTFQLVTQVAGRAGRGDKPGRVVLQTFMPDDAALQFAMKQDFEGFAVHESARRAIAQLPPHARMVRLVLRDLSLEHLHKRDQAIAQQLNDAIAQQQLSIDLRGPMPCAIERISNYHRSQIVLTSHNAATLQKVMSVLREQRGLVSNDKVAIDVDPVSLL
jgi:primosomal protein N' (replication factor Y) (superfamily II helicase)